MFSRRPSLSQVLHTLDRLSIVENTFVVATSDNGQLTMLLEPFGSRSNGPYRHGKFSAWEGGHRVFGLLRWPGRIVPGVSNRLTSHLDLLPTFAALVGAALPERPLDGEDMGPWLFRRANSTSALLRYARRQHDRVLHVYACQVSEFSATRVGKYKVWHNAKDHAPKNFIHDTDADPGETRAAVISAGVKKYILSRANSDFTRVMKSVNADRARPPGPRNNKPATCCNPNFYDCHCPFPVDGLTILASSPPLRLRPATMPLSSADPRCSAPPRNDPALSWDPVANCTPIPLSGTGTSFVGENPQCL